MSAWLLSTSFALACRSIKTEEVEVCLDGVTRFVQKWMLIRDDSVEGKKQSYFWVTVGARGKNGAR